MSKETALTEETIVEPQPFWIAGSVTSSSTVSVGA